MRCVKGKTNMREGEKTNMREEQPNMREGEKCNMRERKNAACVREEMQHV